jgi:pimeloyl-ACP methyl ester carboxylesterase
MAESAEMLILGTNDNFLSQENGRRIAAAMPHGTFYPAEGTDHVPWLEKPEDVGRLIPDFLQG